MQLSLDNWKTQIKKGYLELCLLTLIQRQRRMYGFEILDALTHLELPLKEGTLYPLLNRLTEERVLESRWETENTKGHPRKFYSLTPKGAAHLDEMITEFDRMIKILKEINLYMKGNA